MREAGGGEMLKRGRPAIIFVNLVACCLVRLQHFLGVNRVPDDGQVGQNVQATRRFLLGLFGIGRLTACAGGGHPHRTTARPAARATARLCSAARGCADVKASFADSAE